MLNVHRRDCQLKKSIFDVRINYKIAANLFWLISRPQVTDEGQQQIYVVGLS